MGGESAEGKVNWETNISGEGKVKKGKSGGKKRPRTISSHVEGQGKRKEAREGSVK